jgi:hypothetical protein
MVDMQLAWHWQKINKMCLNVEFQLPLLLTGITMVSYGRTSQGTKVPDKFAFRLQGRVKDVTTHNKLSTML